MWTPKRVLLLVLGFAVFITAYFVYAHFLGAIDGLPDLPRTYWPNPEGPTPPPVDPNKPLTAEVTVTNTGKLAGDEVAQFYLSFPPVAGAPIRALRAFQRVHLEPGQSQQVKFDLKPRDLSMVNEAGDPLVPQGEFKVSVGGGQPDTGAPTATGTFKVAATLMLPE